MGILDLQPIQTLEIPDVGDINQRGLTLIVGPNSSGKSQLLRDVYHSICGDRRNLVVASRLEILKPIYEDLIANLIGDNLIKDVEVDDNGQRHFIPTTTYLGSGAGVNQINVSDAKQWYSQYDTHIKQRRQNLFLNYFGRMLVSALFLDRRLTALQGVGIIDFENNPPSHDLHVLWTNDAARQRLDEEIKASFGRSIWPDNSRGSNLSLKVSDRADRPTSEERLSFSEMAKYRSIEEEGDGLKSYVATCITMLLGRRPVTIIDEPEMCLHPPQAYNLGQFIGRYGTSRETTTLVATHSSHLLRGILSTTNEVRIVRMTRRGGQFHAHLLPAADLAKAVTKPTLRAESVLDGIFSQGVVVVEAEGDRLVYSSVLETLADEFRLDVHFAPVGGTEGLSGTCGLYQVLKIPVAVVADLDALSSIDRLERILDAMTDAETSAAILDFAVPILEAIQKLPPTISENEVRNRIAEIGAGSMNWQIGDDAALTRKLRDLSRELDRMRRLKRGAMQELPPEISGKLSQLLEKLAAVGIFLVPVGELEDWLGDEPMKSSRSNNKWAWANEAVIAIQNKGAQLGDVWDFVRGVAKYLNSQLN